MAHLLRICSAFAPHCGPPPEDFQEFSAALAIVSGHLTVGFLADPVYMVCWARWGKLARFKDSWFMLVLWGGWGDHGKGDFSCRGDRRHQETGANDFEYNRTRLLGQSHKKDSFGVESPLIHDHPWSSMTYLHWKPLCFPHSGEREQRLFDKLPLECKEDQKSLECPGHIIWQSAPSACCQGLYRLHQITKASGQRGV